MALTPMAIRPDLKGQAFQGGKIRLPVCVIQFYRRLIPSPYKYLIGRLPAHATGVGATLQARRDSRRKAALASAPGFGDVSSPVVSETGDQAAALVWKRMPARLARVRGPVAQPDRATVS